MKTRFWLLPMLCMSLMLISATSSKVSNPVANNPVTVEAPSVATSVKSQLSFVERLLLKFVVRKFKKVEDTAKADKQAKNTLTFGIIAISALVVGLVIPYVFFLTIPAGIVAMSTGNSALSGGTTEPGKARTGKALGLGSLIAFGVLLIAALLIVAAFLGSWGG